METCKASISGLCLAVTMNNPYCEPECVKFCGYCGEEEDSCGCDEATVFLYPPGEYGTMKESAQSDGSEI